MITLSSDIDEIKIPEHVAVCPDCKTQLTIYPDGWVQDDDDLWICDSFTQSCATEPDIDDPAYDEWDAAHPSFDEPYEYWLPVHVKIEQWLKKNYRFVDR